MIDIQPTTTQHPIQAEVPAYEIAESIDASINSVWGTSLEDVLTDAIEEGLLSKHNISVDAFAKDIIPFFIEYVLNKSTYQLDMPLNGFPFDDNE